MLWKPVPNHIPLSHFYQIPPDQTIDNLGSHSLLGARANYVFGPEQQYEISAFGENLLADTYCEFQFNLNPLNGVAYCIPNEGQALWGVQARLRF